MGWEQRGSYQYYIRKEKRHGRTVRMSYGRGQAAITAATADAQRRQAQESARTAQTHLAALDRQLDAVVGFIEQLMQATLLVTGYHQHHRSEWRKRHE